MSRLILDASSLTPNNSFLFLDFPTLISVPRNSALLQRTNQSVPCCSTVKVPMQFLRLLIPPLSLFLSFSRNPPILHQSAITVLYASSYEEGGMKIFSSVRFRLY